MVNAKEIWDKFKEYGLPPVNEGIEIKIENADKLLYDLALSYFAKVGQTFDIQPVKEQYRAVADWLSGNEGKGLFLYGGHGLGKTVLAKYLIPAALILGAEKVCKYYAATTMRDKIKDILSHAIIVLDDIGVESVSVEYGNRRNLIDEIVDDVEQNGKLLIVTSNLDAKDIIAKYGDGVFDRLCAITKRVMFSGESFRTKKK